MDLLLLSFINNRQVIHGKKMKNLDKLKKNFKVNFLNFPIIFLPDIKRGGGQLLQNLFSKNVAARKVKWHPLPLLYVPK